MKKTLLDKIMREGIVDTTTYRYIIQNNTIMRLPIVLLGTDAAYREWEIVKVL